MFLASSRRSGFELAEERTAADQAPGARAGGLAQRAVGGDEPRAGTLRRLPDQPIVGTLGPRADQRRPLIEPLLTDDGYIYVDYDVNRTPTGSITTLDDLPGWIDAAFKFVREKTIMFLEEAS